MAALVTELPRSALREAIDLTPQGREPFDAERHRGRFVVAGLRSEWSAARRKLQQAGARVVAFYDSRRRVPLLTFEGLPIIRTSFFLKLAGLRVAFAGPPRKAWFDGPPAGVSECVWLSLPEPWQMRGRHQPDLLAQRSDELHEVYSLLHDDDSRRIYAAVVRARLEGDTGYHRVASYREYCHPVVQARPGFTVVDAGAYNGDSTTMFVRKVGRRGQVVALEPVLSNYRKLVARRLSRAVPLCVGAWSRPEVLSFEERGGSSRVNEQGEVKIHVSSIDAIAADLGLERVDLIKLDVEGAERQALEGAASTIARHRPMLQVSIYHRSEDLYELPLTLMRSLSDYRFYLGHHSFYQMETDLYAIPRERLSR